MSKTPQRRKVPAVRKTVQILWYLAKSEQGGRASHIASALGIFPSTCTHILHELLLAGFVTYDDASRIYRIGPTISEIAGYTSAVNSIGLTSRPILRSLASEFPVTSSLIERTYGDQYLMVVEAERAQSGPAIYVSPGNRVPILAGAAGQCVAAYSSFEPAQLRREFDRVRWEVPISFEDWQSQLDIVRERGYSIDKNFFRGATVVAVPVFSFERMTRMVAATFISSNVGRELEQRIIEALHNAARAIEAAMGENGEAMPSHREARRG